MKLISTLGLLVAALAGCQSAADVDAPGLLAQAINDETRLAEQVARDDGRNPAGVLAFSGIEPGDTIADIAVGGGYYTAILSRYLGASGKIYAVDPARIFEAFPQAADGFPTYIAQDPRPNVDYSVQNLDAFTVPEPLDHIVMILYYHDTLWTGEDRPAMNKAFFDALKPGGTLLILDHDAKPLAGAEIGQTLHRMDCDLIAPELVAAGFELEATSDLLRNPDDPRDVSVFDQAWRGRTDRCLMRFRKPAAS